MILVLPPSLWEIRRQLGFFLAQKKPDNLVVGRQLADQFVSSEDWDRVPKFTKQEAIDYVLHDLFPPKERKAILTVIK